jgi:NB-ARC domain
MNELTFEVALRRIEGEMTTKAKRHLNEVEKVLIEGAWKGQTFAKMSMSSSWSQNYLRQSGFQLWEVLSAILGEGEKLGKLNLRSFLEEKWAGEIPCAAINEDKKPRSLAQKVYLGAQPPSTQPFYGREEELKWLDEALGSTKLVAITGSEGIGKTTLASKVLEQIGSSDHGFKRIIWKSINHAPALNTLIEEILDVLNIATAKGKIAPQKEELTNTLFKWLAHHRTLIVIDGAESVLSKQAEDSSSGEYNSFFRRIVQEQHSSCVLINSQTLPLNLRRIPMGQTFKVLRLEGLSKEAAMDMIRNSGLKGELAMEKLISAYDGNPYLIKLGAGRILKLFGGDVEKTTRFGTFVTRDYVVSVCNRLFQENDESAQLKRLILSHLIQQKNPVSCSNIKQALTDRRVVISYSQLVDVLDDLESNQLIRLHFDSQIDERCVEINDLARKYLPTISQFDLKSA